MNTTWHPDDDLLDQYLDGEAGPLRGAALEQHLTGCAHCRARMNAVVEPAPLEMIWDRIQEQAQAPRPTRVERWLTRLGVSEPDALLVAVAPSLRASWLFGVAVALGFVALAAAYGGERGTAFFLLVAPLVPVAGVAFAYGPDVDPSYEASAAAPYPAARLLLLRTSAVLATSLPLVLAAHLVVPELTWTTVSWLLPAVAFTALLLAACTWTRPTYAATVLGIIWACAVGSALLDHDPTGVLDPGMLAIYAVLGIAAGFVFRLRIRKLTLLGSLS